MKQRRRVVLVHGLAGSSRWWSTTAAALADGFDVRTVDLARAPVAERPALVRAALGTPGYLVGHSLGGLVCARVAGNWPELVERLVLVAPAGASPRRAAANAVPLARTLIGARPSFVRLLVADAMRTGPRALWRAGRDVLADDVVAELGAVRAPTLLVWGDRDPLIPPRLARVFAERLEDARVAVIPRARHVPMVERPDEFNRALLEFLV